MRALKASVSSESAELPEGQPRILRRPEMRKIGETSIDDQSVRGAVSGGGRSAAWELRIEPGGEPPVKLLTERGYRWVARRWGPLG